MSPPKPLTVVIVDDAAPARALIREYLEQHSDVQVVAECTNGLEAVKAANELRPDLLFLDIQMPKLDGFEVLDLIGRDAAGVVFTTAYDDYDHDPSLRAAVLFGHGEHFSRGIDDRLTPCANHLKILNRKPACLRVAAINLL